MANELSTVKVSFPALAAASAALQAQVADVADNLESMEGFQLPRVKMTPSGFELTEGEDTLLELEGVILHSCKKNVYYKDAYNPNEAVPPTCFSQDGAVPHESVEDPIHPTCKGCPMAEFGTNSMKSGKACRNLKPLYMLLGDQSWIPRQVTVTPSSLKAANKYLMDLTERGIGYRNVVTKIQLHKTDKKQTYFEMRFSVGKKLDDVRKNDVLLLKNYWLPVMNNQTIDPLEAEGRTVVEPKSAQNVPPKHGYGEDELSNVGL